MNLVTIFFLSIGLSFDTFAVSVTCGLAQKNILFWQAVRVAFFLALFLTLMPVAGWFIGSSIKGYILKFDYWIAFILLTFLGIKMIIESFKKEKFKSFNPLDIKIILGLSLATSIDALIVGFSIGFFTVNILFSLFILGSVTFIVGMLGMLFGKKVGSRFGKKMEIIGGLILLFIGLKILLDNL